MKIKILIIVALFLTLIFFLDCSKKDKNPQMSQLQKITVKRGNLGIKIEETGEVQPKSIVDLKSKVSGKVVKLYVQENDFVKIGQLIADIEPDYNQARTISSTKNELRMAEIRHKDAIKSLEEGKKLKANNYISDLDYEKLEDDLEIAVLSLDIAKEQYSLIEDIETRNNISKVYSTSSGTVIERKVEEGEMVQSSASSFSDGTVILRVADLRKMIVKSSINEVDISKITETQKVNIKIDAFPYDAFDGVISKISAQAKSENNVKVFPIEIEITQQDNRLRPGLSANITILGDMRENILLIPIRAIFSDANGNDIIYKIENDSIRAGTMVKTGINDLQQVEVLEGLEENDEISLKEPN